MQAFSVLVKKCMITLTGRREPQTTLNGFRLWFFSFPRMEDEEDEILYVLFKRKPNVIHPPDQRHRIDLY